MKKGWKEITLKEVANYRRGSFPQPYGNPEWYDGEESMPFVQVAELQEDSFSLIMPTKKKISKIAQPLSIFVPKGTVLVSLQGSIGKVGITEDDCYVDRTIAIFQSFKIPVEINFFAYQLKIRFSIERLKARGTTIKTITKEEFANFTVMLPPLSEQKEIVEYLDSSFAKIETLKANAAKNLDEAKALFQSALKEALEPKKGWEEKTINDVVLFRNGIAHEKDIDKGGNYIVINSKFVATEGTIRKYTNEQLSPLYTNEIVMVMSDVPKGKTLAKCYIIDCDNKYSLNQRICAFKSKGLDVKFLYYMLNRNPNLLKYDNGENQTNLRKNQILECPVTYPVQKNEQQEIVDKLDSLKSKVDRLQENFDKISMECDALKQAILRQVFE